jgi:hypothetical protein
MLASTVKRILELRNCGAPINTFANTTAAATRPASRSCQASGFRRPSWKPVRGGMDAEDGSNELRVHAPILAN